nr:hypothetical protein A5881_003533 [Enterococcus termitis]
MRNFAPFGRQVLFIISSGGASRCDSQQKRTLNNRVCVK